MSHLVTLFKPGQASHTYLSDVTPGHTFQTRSWSRVVSHTPVGHPQADPAPPSKAAPPPSYDPLVRVSAFSGLARVIAGVGCGSTYLYCTQVGRAGAGFSRDSSMESCSEAWSHLTADPTMSHFAAPVTLCDTSPHRVTTGHT